MTAKRLTLLRHAKSSWGDPNIDDHDRPLNGRGQRAAAKVGVYLRRHDLVPDLVLCSSAVRTRQTLVLLDLGLEPDIHIEDAIYAASAATLLSRLHRVDDRYASVLLIGHNPGIQDLSLDLTGDRPELAEKYPTGAIADLRVERDRWAQLGPGTAELQAFVVPRDLD